MDLIVDDLHIHADDRGEGKVLLLVHGWGSNLQTFGPLADQLSKHFRVISVDLPGFGGSQAPNQESAWSLPEYAHFLKRFLAKLKITRLYAYVGHSMGGRIGLYALGNRVLEAEKLVLLSSHGIRESNSARNVGYRIAAKTGKAATAFFPRKVRTRLRRLLYSHAGATDYLEAGPLRDSFVKIINTDGQSDAKRISVPTLLLYGAHDSDTPPRYGELFANLMAHATLRVIPDAGHFVHLDQADKVGDLIEEFLNA